MALKGPLTGVRVIDLTHAHAGPYGTQMLGDLGAEVIKVEPPTGDMIRSDVFGPKGGYYIQALNRNKKGVVLDLTTPSGKEALREMVKVSDVIMDNFRLGAMQRLGFDYESVKKLNPKIISASISGYGSSGPYSEYPSFDDIAQAIAGMASLSGEKDGPPIRSGAAVADICAGVFCTYGIVTALYERSKTGQGRRVEVNLLDTVMALLDNMYGYYFFFNEVPRAQGSRHTTGLLGFYKAKDGYMALSPSWPRIARVVNREWMVDDPRFKEPAARRENKKILEDLIEEALGEANVEDWVNLMRAEDIACGPVNDLAQSLQDPQIQHNKPVLEMVHPTYGKTRAIGCPIKFPGAISGDNTPPPMLGEHTVDVLKSLLHWSDEKVAALKKEQADAAEATKARTRKGR